MGKRFEAVVGPGAAILSVCLVCAAALSACLLAAGMNTGSTVTVQMQVFTESSRDLRNPNRGFFDLYRFEITDEREDYEARVREYCNVDSGFTLALVEINLKNYRDGDISQAGLDNIDTLLEAWAGSGKQLILRPLYDWDGKSIDTEPESLDIILRHIGQTGPVLRRHAGVIFTLQGLFVGDCGEMHDTKFSVDDMRELALALDDATGNRMYLSVRTPVQWQTVTEQGTNRLTDRMGLFNDGMLGSETDLGTYVTMTRAEGLAFQEELCARVPNGGEVTVDKSAFEFVRYRYSDFENAVVDMAAMHVTYLNRWWNPDVLDKWAAVTVSDGSCFDGMNGLDYISRHLGYRLLIDNAAVSTELSPQGIGVSVDFRNVGFAPMYIPPEVTLVLQDETDNEILSCLMDHELTALSGGRGASETGTARAEISLQNLTDGSYKIYMDLKDPVTGMPVLLANEQEHGENGYFLGAVTLSGGSCFAFPGTGGPRGDVIQKADTFA